MYYFNLWMHFNQFRAILINSRSLSINPRSLSINSGHFKSIQEHFSSIRMHFLDSNEFYPPKIHFMHILIGSDGHFFAIFSAFYPIFWLFFKLFDPFRVVVAIPVFQGPVWSLFGALFDCFGGTFSNYLGTFQTFGHFSRGPGFTADYAFYPILSNFMHFMQSGPQSKYFLCYFQKDSGHF